MLDKSQKRVRSRKDQRFRMGEERSGSGGKIFDVGMFLRRIALGRQCKATLACWLVGRSTFRLFALLCKTCFARFECSAS
jgi:hypothetical protein